MGMYTEVFVNCRLKEDISPADLAVLQFLFNGKPLKPEYAGLVGLPFGGDRGDQIGSMCSYYFIPYYTSDMRFDDIAKQWYIVSRSDLKNYDKEIENFFEWLKPLVDITEENEEPLFIGYHRYEEHSQPTLVFVEPINAGQK